MDSNPAPDNTQEMQCDEQAGSPALQSLNIDESEYFSFINNDGYEWVSTSSSELNLPSHHGSYHSPAVTRNGDRMGNTINTDNDLSTYLNMIRRNVAETHETEPLNLHQLGTNVFVGPSTDEFQEVEAEVEAELEAELEAEVEAELEAEVEAELEAELELPRPMVMRMTRNFDGGWRLGIDHEIKMPNPNGLTEFQINKIPSDCYPDHPSAIYQTSCVICIGDFQKLEALRILPCSHIFHVRCVDKWLLTNRTCPTCRRDAAP